jgi:type I restriction enzyme R subunit
VVVSSDGTNEKAEIVAARKHAKAVNAVENFKRPFNYDDPEKVNTGVALLIVCDMLLTGFDAPIEQVMYIDKKIRDHNLLQTIARVNRIASGKSRGYIIDYIGLANHLKEALSIYAASDQADIQATLTDITTELPVLEARYRRLLQLFQSLGIEAIENFVQQTLSPAQEGSTQEQAIEVMADPRQRANFEVYLKKFMQSLDIILPNIFAHPYKVPAKRFGYLMAKVKERYKDDSLSFSGSGEKVKKLIDEHLISLGINPKIPPVELLSPNFIQQVEQNKTSKAKASEMEHAIRKHCKVHFPEDPALYARLSEKLEALIQKYNDDWDELSRTLFEVYEEALAGRQDGTNPFYDLIAQIAFGEAGVPQQHQAALHQLVEEIIEKLRNTINIINFWNNQPEVSRLKGELSDLILFSGIDPLAEQSEKLAAEVTALAKARQQHLRL